MYETESRRWQAIANRDQAASSAFVYAVISTKIYCRPACPSRLARRANVCFFDTAEQAAAAGYRPCLRCKPDQPDVQADSHNVRHDAVRRACEYIEQAKGEAKFADVATHVGLSTRYLYSIFKEVTGTTPAKYAERFKPTSTNTKEASGTASVVSDAVSSGCDLAVEPMLDLATWNALPDFDWVDGMIPQDNLCVGLQYNTDFDTFAPPASVDGKSFGLAEPWDLMSSDWNNQFLTDMYTLDPAVNVRHG